MINKIAGWDDLDATKEVVEFESIEKGIYPCVIMGVEDDPNKEYLIIKFDIAKGDKQYIFSKQCNKDLENWPKQGTTYRSYKTTASKFFRAFITALEKSNASKNFKWNWDETKLVGLYFAGVFGEEEYLDKNNEVKISTKLQEIRSLQAMKNGEIKIPELKKLKTTKDGKVDINGTIVAPTKNNNDIVSMDIDDDDLPF